MQIRFHQAVVVALVVSGCAELAPPKAAPAPEPVAASPVANLGVGKSAEALDKTTAAEKAAAVAAPTAGRELGATVVTLGSPAEQGFWLRSSLVTVAGKGHVTTAGGASVNVDLQPGSGPAQLSLAAFRALGLPLTDLADVTVFAD